MLLIQQGVQQVGGDKRHISQTHQQAGRAHGAGQTHPGMQGGRQAHSRVLNTLAAQARAVVWHGMDKGRQIGPVGREQNPDMGSSTVQGVA